MAEHPIIFNSKSIQAIVAGAKSQTRRVVKPLVYMKKYCNLRWGGFEDFQEANTAAATAAKLNLSQGLKVCPYGEVGDKLWVRETWGSPDADYIRCKEGRKPKLGDKIVYRANPADDYQWSKGKPSQGSFCWRSPIFMPKWAARIWLEITGMRVERLQDISEEDAIAEGIGYGFQRNSGWPDYLHIKNGICELTQDTARMSYSTYWDSINAKRGHPWENNDWVWVIEFKQIESEE